MKGQPVSQLCVPEGRMASVFKLAHDSVVGDYDVKHVHANTLRRFIVLVSGCVVVNDTENEFGPVVTPANVDVSVCPSARIEETKLEHLDPQLRQQLLQLLDEFADRFSDKSGLCEATVHRIRTTSEFVPRQMRPHRVPDKFKPEVDLQIAKLLEMRLVRPSDSPIASPIVCVAKRDGGVRLAVYYRYLNKCTIGDAYPMSTIDEIVRSVGRWHQHVRRLVWILADPYRARGPMAIRVRDPRRSLRMGQDAVQVEERRSYLRPSCAFCSAADPILC